MSQCVCPYTQDALFLLPKITNNPILWFDIEKGGSCKIEHLNELKLIIMINGYGYNKLHEAMFFTRKMNIFCPKIDPQVAFSREKPISVLKFTNWPLWHMGSGNIMWSIVRAFICSEGSSLIAWKFQIKMTRFSFVCFSKFFKIPSSGSLFLFLWCVAS